MENSVKLSNRLQLVASFLPRGAVFADIGSDHAYLPCFVCLNDKDSRGVAGEVNEGPFQSAVRTVENYQLSDRIEVRLGNGLEVLHPNEVQQIVIAGMGGSLIKSILEQGKDKLGTVERVIAQPNVDERNIRKWFHENNYGIVHEEIIEENGHIYEIIVADKENSDNKFESLTSEKQFLFGPILMENKPAAFYKKWKFEREKRVRIIMQLKQSNVEQTEKIMEFERELEWIEEVLKK